MGRRGKITVKVTVKRTIRVTTRTRTLIPVYQPQRPRLVAPNQCIECGATGVELTIDDVCHDCADQ
jgi:hypothetical protein